MSTATRTLAETVSRWFEEQVPTAWRAGSLEVLIDDDEILVVVPLAAAEPSNKTEAPVAPAATEQGDPGTEGSSPEAEASRPDPGRVIAEFRAETKEERIAVARQAEGLFRRHVSWGATSEGTRQLFTTLTVPVMTRLRLPDRALLDTLVESGVARSRSDAVAWCVRLVSKHESDWVEELRQALVEVRRVRQEGPHVA